MLVIHPSLEARKGQRCGLVRSLAATLLAIVWTVALSFAATTLWAGAPEQPQDQPAISETAPAEPATSLKP